MTGTDLAGRIGVVTGGARGIGLAIATKLVAMGARVALWDIDGATAEKAAGALGDAAIAVAADVTDPAAISRALADTEERLGPVSLLVNNAGIAGPSKPTWEYQPEEWNAVVNLDLTGVYLCCRAIVPGMRDRGWGRIVNIASIAGKEGNPNASAYSAAKAGVIGFTKSLGKELATSGVLVNCITPAAVKTDIFDQVSEEHIQYMLSKIPMGRFGLVEEMAELVGWLCSESCSFSTGAVFDISGGRATY